MLKEKLAHYSMNVIFLKRILKKLAKLECFDDRKTHICTVQNFLRFLNESFHTRYGLGLGLHSWRLIYVTQGSTLYSNSHRLVIN